tara:strand:- start:864 stop:1397 length:534 start_codon:yes stop_codon:yes gene_type:complete
MINLINSITIIRILLAPIIFIFLLFGNYFLCIFLFFIAGASDYLDGHLARKYNAVSELGEILDPIADKILIIFVLFGLSVSLDSFIIAFSSSFIIAREIGVTALRDYSSRNNLSHKTKVTYLAKVKTALQLFAIGSYLFALSISFNLLIIISDILLIIAALVTLYTGYQYANNVFQE